jgi:hypothetical protein
MIPRTYLSPYVKNLIGNDGTHLTLIPLAYQPSALLRFVITEAYGKGPLNNTSEHEKLLENFRMKSLSAGFCRGNIRTQRVRIITGMFPGVKYK